MACQGLQEQISLRPQVGQGMWQGPHEGSIPTLQDEFRRLGKHEGSSADTRQRGRRRGGVHRCAGVRLDRGARLSEGMSLQKERRSD